jgi:uncharacterized protein
MKAPWRRLKSSWRARGDSNLSAALTGQVRAARDGAALTKAMVSKKIDPAEARAQIAEIEHRGDEQRAELVEQLSRTLVAPLDREDLFRLSRSIDDILDTIRDFVREADLYQIEKRRTYRPFLDSVVAAIEASRHHPRYRRGNDVSPAPIRRACRRATSPWVAPKHFA